VSIDNIRPFNQNFLVDRCTVVVNSFSELH
jgi:hypothetical protein